MYAHTDKGIFSCIHRDEVFAKRMKGSPTSLPAKHGFTSHKKALLGAPFCAKRVDFGGFFRYDEEAIFTVSVRG